MYAKKYLLILFTLIFTSVVFAQNYGSASSNVSISLKKGLSINNVNGDNLNFTEVVLTSSNQNVSSTNQVRFLVTGQNGATIDVNYPTTIDLSDDGSNTITFTSTFEETGETTTYTGGSTVGDGSSQTLGTNGLLNLWLSGSILVPSDAVAGSYSGTFSVDVAYN